MPCPQIVLGEIALRTPRLNANKSALHLGDHCLRSVHVGAGLRVGILFLDLPCFCGERSAHFPCLSLEGDGALEAERRMPPDGVIELDTQIFCDLPPRPAARQCQPNCFTPKLRRRPVSVSHRTPPGSSVGALYIPRASPSRFRGGA